MMKEGTLVLPGDRIAISEELQSGEGTYEENGEIIAQVTGKFIINRNKMAALVKPATSVPLLLKKGTVVICEITQIGDSIAIAPILHVAGNKRQITGERDAAIHISNISDSYIESIKAKFGVGDIIRAKVIQSTPVVRLTTKDKELGVIRAYCKNCRNPLLKKKNLLECPVCGKDQDRKISSDYGEGNLDLVYDHGSKHKKRRS